MRLPCNIIEFVFPSLLCQGNSSHIYLTFDDGPSPHTLPILDVLRQYNIPATFFLVGKQVVQYPEYVQAIVENHHQIGNHTYTHPLLFWKTTTQLHNELRATNEAITAVTQIPITFFRPPYGYVTPSIVRVAKKLQLQTVLWSFDTRDFSHTEQSLTKIKLNKIRNGDIILCHDNELAAPLIGKVLEQLINHCLKHGYTFASLKK